MPTRALLTYSDYAALPDDGRRYELRHGELSEIQMDRRQKPRRCSNLIGCSTGRSAGKAAAERVLRKNEELYRRLA